MVELRCDMDLQLEDFVSSIIEELDTGSIERSDGTAEHEERVEALVREGKAPSKYGQCGSVKTASYVNVILDSSFIV